MDCYNILPIDTLYDNLNLANTPNIIGISDINFIANLDSSNFPLDLPHVVLALLSFPGYFDIGFLTFYNDLLYNIIDCETGSQQCSFGISDCLFTNEACLPNNKVLINAFKAKIMSANCRLRFVQEVET